MTDEHWMCERYSKKRWGIARSGGPAQLIVSPPQGQTFSGRSEKLIVAMLNGLEDYLPRNADARPHCCEPNCYEDAAWEARWGPAPDDYTHACPNHLGTLVRPGTVEVSAIAGGLFA